MNNTCINCQHWGPAKEHFGYCYLADFHNPHKDKFVAEPWDAGNDARLKTHETFACNQFQKKYGGEK